MAAVVVSCADALPRLSCRLPWLPWWMLASAATLHLRLPMCFCLPVIGSVCKGLVVEALPPVLSCCIVCVCGIVLVILGLPASRYLVRCCLLPLNEIRATRHVREKKPSSPGALSDGIIFIILSISATRKGEANSVSSTSP